MFSYRNERARVLVRGVQADLRPVAYGGRDQGFVGVYEGFARTRVSRGNGRSAGWYCECPSPGFEPE